MNVSKILAACLVAASCASASAGVITAYQQNGSTTYTANDNDAFRSEKLTPEITGSILVDFYLTFNDIKDNENDFLGLWFGYDAFGTNKDINIGGDHTNGPNIGLKSQSGNLSDSFVRLQGTSTTGSQWLDGGMISGAEVRIFGHLYKTSGQTTYNRFDAWFNPIGDATAILATERDGYASLTSGVLNTVNVFGLRTANLHSGESVTIRDLKIQAVPEPGTLALTGIALLGLGALRRRKKA